MLLCPLDYRYGRKEIKNIFSEENRLLTQLKVEAALSRAHAKLGNIPAAAAKEITKKANLRSVSNDRVKEIEAETKHDVMAVVKALSEQCGDAGRYVHLGATSNDIIDTASAMQIMEGLDLLDKDLDKLIATLAGIAERHRNTLMVGRTHGQFAIPTTFGFKVAGFLSEVMRHKERLAEMRKRVCVGKMSGAIGTGAALGPKVLEIQDIVMEDLGLGVEEAATQIVCRDRYAELVSTLSIICTSCERYSTEIRNLQRSEIMEVAEAFDVKKQVGSSTMAQKRNPVISENICGLSRIVRAFVTPALEDMVLWHERDLTNSSAERFILPHVFVLTDEILVKMEQVFAGLVVYDKNMLRNIESANGLIMAEPVMITLVSKGMGRQDAHEIVRSSSMKAEDQGRSFKEMLLKDKQVSKLMTKAELDKVMDPHNYVGKAPELTDKVVARAKKMAKPKKK
ncbi:MAG: Fumarate hydratase class II [Methanomassiliicoccales archaeon PtaU1.Bin124]|nr:MAG: Fumarate hydratase class II [Methanomassiliicoccales archaeon PtaU1.Bin124]